MKLSLFLLTGYCAVAMTACHSERKPLPEIIFPSDTTVVLRRRFVAYDDSSVTNGLHFHLDAREVLDSARRSFHFDPVHSTSRDDLKWIPEDKIFSSVFKKGIQLFITGKTNGETAIITAGKAIYSPEQKEFLFSENVVLYNSRGDSLLTDSLKWERNKFLFSTGSAIVLKNREREIRGEGLEANETFGRFSIRNVKGITVAGQGE